MKFRDYILAGIILVAAGFFAVYLFGNHPGGERTDLSGAAAWERMASPGALSRSHAFLEHDCASCHTATKGPEAGKCIACHANNESLLKRQPSAFHATIGSCRECHREHQGIDRRPTDMDHLALADIGLRQLKADRRPDSEDEVARKQLLDWIGQHQPAGHTTPDRSSLTSREEVLNCAACHSNKDRHDNLFGQDCAQCHTTAKWTIPEFRHPSPRSMDCAQCHQATPWHYMEMCYQMMTKVARQPTAKVNECYKCHKTTSWNDIQGIGKLNPGCPCMNMMSGDVGGPGQSGKMQTDNLGGMVTMRSRGATDTAAGAASNQSEIQALLAGAEEMFRTNRLLRATPNALTESTTSTANTSPNELEKWSGPELGLFTLKSLSSSDVAMSDFRGKPVIIHFFATWCEPCRDEMVGMQRFVSQIKNKELSVLAVSVGESEDRVRRFFDSAPVNFPILLDQDKTISKAWRVTTLPTTYVLSPELKPKLILRGAQQWDQLDVAKILKKLDEANREPSQTVGGERAASPEKK